ncbi:MAG: hypothetical protein JW768_01165 [Chitinispirillaceae bacterium]|nr:hypothetical protein [Chitinispirillaceae bacterium]
MNKALPASLKRGIALLAIPCFLFLLIPAASHAVMKPAAALLNDLGQKPILVQSSLPQTNLIRLEYQVPAPLFQQMNHQFMKNKALQRCFLGNAIFYGKPGQPELPLVYSRVILPAGHTVESISFIPKKEITLPGAYTLSYAEIPHPLSATTITWAKPDMAIYDSDNGYPGKRYDLTSIQYRCGAPIAEIDIYPMTYYPKSGTIKYCREFALEVKTKPDPTGGSDLAPRVERFFDGYLMTEENPEMLAIYPKPLRKNASSDNYEWIVISEDTVLSATTTPNLQTLIEFRQSKGFTARGVPMSEVRQQSGSANSDKLRNFIKYAYENWNTKWVLLAGDINIIPLRTVQASNGSETDNLPTDMPYQCLDGTTWNNDYAAEVFIGRFSGQTRAEIANQIFKTIEYESGAASESYYTNGLSLGEKLDNTTYGTSCMNQLEELFPSEWDFDSLYDSPTYTWNSSALLTKINSDQFSIINHLGHSNATYGMKLRNGNESQFNNEKFIFVKSQGCIPGAFDRDCFAERITTQTRTGFFGAVMNSRYGWYSPRNPTSGSSHIVHRSFWQACWNEDMSYFGEFNEYSHRINTRYRWDILESNLFGDPAVLFKGKEAEPFIQVVSPNGGEEWEAGRTFPVRWDANVEGNLKIELIKGTAVNQTLTTSTPNTGSWNWAIPESFTQGSDYKIRITSVQTTSLRDESNATFTIGPRSELSVVAPNGGENFEKGTVCEITWTDNLSGNVSIILYRDSSIILDIVENTASDGSYNWTIPSTVQSGSNYWVRVVSVDKEWLWDENDGAFSIRNPAVAIPYTQTFESFDVGTVPLIQYWEQLDDDDLDWTIIQGPTPSRNGSSPNVTGPMADHTSGNATGKYIYVEASSNNSPDKEAQMVTPLFSLVGVVSAQMGFFYHMYSDSNHMGDLYVDARIEGSATWTEGIIHISGDQGDQWKQQVFDLNAYVGQLVQFRFRGITGESWASDICIDDFSITGGTGNPVRRAALPATFGLSFSGSLLTYLIPATVPAKVPVTIALYNLQGKQVQTLVNGAMNPGRYTIDLAASQSRTAKGLYICAMKAGDFSAVERVTVR